MKFITEQTDFKAVLDVVKKAVASHAVLPSLEGIYINVNEDIKVYTSSIDFEISDTLVGTVIEKGSVCVNAKVLTSLISKLPNTQITIYDKGNEFFIECGNKKYKLPIIVSDFPLNNTTDYNSPLHISNFSEIVGDVIYSVNQNDINPAMSSVAIDFANGKMKGLDGQRIAIREFASDTSKGEILVPAKFLSKITLDEVDISYNDRFVKIVKDTTVVYIKLLDTKFFDIERLLTGDTTTTITIDREDYINNLQLLSLLISEAHKVPVVHNISNKLELSVTSGIGNGHEEIDCKIDGEALQIAINPKYMIEALSHIKEDVVDVRMNGAKNPVIIKGDGYMHLMMPVALRG